MSHLRIHSFTGTTDHDFTGLVAGELIQYDGSGISSAGVLPASGTSANLWSASTGSNSIIANNGTGNVASGNFAIAGGAWSTAGGSFSVNFGAASSTPGEASFAAAANFGSAVGDFSSVIGGEDNTATGYSSSVIASNLSTANGSRSVVIASDGLTNSFNNTLMTMNARLAEGSGSVIYSAGTDLYDIFSTGGGGISGSGTFGVIPLWTGSTTISDSILSQQSNTGITVDGTFKINKQISHEEITSNTGTNYTADLSEGNIFKLTANNNFTLDYSNAKTGTYIFIIQQDGTGNRAISFASSKFRASSGLEPILSTTAGAVDILSCIYSEVDNRMYVYDSNNLQDI